VSYLFVDNYRGFSNTLIPITDVNFLVGENSTGKTSILALFELMSGPGFWTNLDFDSQKVGFGTFRDVVSINASDNSYFTVGVLFDKFENDANIREQKPKNKKNEKEISPSLYALIMTFNEKEGMPKLASFVRYKNGVEFLVKFVGKGVRYKFRHRRHNLCAAEFATKRFHDWVAEFQKENTGYTLLKGPPQLFEVPLFILMSVLETQARKEIPDDKVDLIDFTSFFSSVAWLAPIRSKPRKTYDEFSLEFSPEGDHTPYLIKKRLDSKLESPKFKKYLSQVGEKSGLFKKIEIKNYGRGAAAPFELDIILNKFPLSVSSVGYGVSQALPVIVEIFTRPKESWFAIQQPEVHLHPKAQAYLGEIFFNLAVSENKKFIIETHSDYTIDRFRIQYRKKGKKPKSQILFFEYSGNGNKVTPIKIDQQGNISSEQPKSYREFFIREEMKILGL